MKKMTVSRTVLTLFLMGVLALGLVLQPVSSHLETRENRAEDRNNGEVIIVEHEISSFELEELRRNLGVFEKGRNYNPKIDGHGTGLRPPSEAEWAEIAERAYCVETIQLAELGTPPPSVDHTTKPWFPPIGNQDGEGSCTAWAVGYYMKTFQEAWEHAWNLSEAEWLGGYTGHPTPAYQDRIMSPDFIYHLINEGVDEGSSFPDAIDLVCTIGACAWQKMPYDPADHASWPSEEAWREAPLYRGNSSGYEYLWLDTNDDITSLKNWIASDHLAVMAVDANKYLFLTSQDIWTLDNYVVSELNHANTIVGYDDNISYTEEGEPRQGAFKIANSWGEGFTGEKIPDGYYWISYEAMKERVEWCMFYRDRIGYDPTLVALFNIDHCNRGECDMLMGMGNHSSPLAAKSFSNPIGGGDYPFCPNDIVVDVTEFEDAVSTVYNQSFFLQVYDQAVLPPHSGTHYWYSDGVTWAWFRLHQAFTIPETGATLSFWTYYEIEADWDYGYIEVYDLDTDEWYTLPGLKTTSAAPETQTNPNCDGYDPWVYSALGRWNALTGFSGDMYQEAMDLTPFAGHTIELSFTYWTDGYVLELGWYVDDIAIPELGFFDDVESGADGWTVQTLPAWADGWHITSPPPSPNGTILAFSIESYDSYIAEALTVASTSHDVPVDTVNLESVFADLILTIAGDVDGDGAVGPDDLTSLAVAYGRTVGDPAYTERADLDYDGDVDAHDLTILAAKYGESV